MKNNKPTDTGLYLVRCMESDYEWESVIITRKPEGLVVHCLHLGATDLDRYHDGLTDIEWKTLVPLNDGETNERA